jgi:hypothetical protein
MALYGILLLGGAVGGSSTAILLAALGGLFHVGAIRLLALALLAVATGYLTLRYPMREWGWHRQVGRRSSFGFTRPIPLMFFWGFELGTGYATVITRSSTIVVGAVAFVSPVPLAAAVGTVYGAARLAMTWRGSLHRPDRDFTAPMRRFDARRRSTHLANTGFVVSVAVAASSLAAVSVL